MAADILIVDDEADIRELISGILQDEGYETRLARNSDAALAALADRRPSLIVLDIWLQDSKLDGLDLLTVIRERHPELPVVIISGHGNIETAVSAIKRGAYDYIEKPFKADRLILVVGRALEASRLRRENEVLKGRAGADVELLGSSMAIRQLRQTLKKIAPSNSRILITGAMGAGKELTARTLHEMSQRSSGPFVILSAATMAPERMEEELFGVEDGSGAPHRVGALEEAHSGTLYLDEIADMPMETQGKVLRVLVEQTFQRVGGGKKVKVDVRIVSSTGRDLSALIAEGRFREDLYHRLSVVPIRVPSLVERREDIPELIEYFSKLYSLASGQPHRKLATDAIATLQTQDWPGNVRQLRNNIERVMILAGGEPGSEITAGMLPADVGASPPSTSGFGGEHLLALPLREAREAFERDYVAAQLSRFGGNISRTAQFVGMERSALHRKIKLLGLAIRGDGEELVAEAK
ncbi:MAG: sigma-54-dependent Fis family transcriptional regulator [Alphaproteobacteria bacterium]|nr:MAG: sigma-54-dependent Fis family transcriptional regulator [Alphaproteobacteria bacterium]